MNFQSTSSSEVKRFRDLANMTTQNSAVLRTAAVGSAAWNVPSSSRCLQCGALGCQQHKVVIDPERKRRNEEAVRMNTPFYRQKLMHRFGEALEQEKFARSQIGEWYWAELKGLWEEHRADLKLLHQISAERQERDRVTVQEKKARHSLRTACRRDEITLSAVLEEREERGFLEQQWLRRGAALRDFHVNMLKLLGTKDQEEWTRQVIVDQQATALGHLFRLHEDCQSCLNDHARSKRMLIEQCLSGRNDLILAREDKMESFASSFKRGIETIEAWYRERHEFALVADRSLREVAAEQEIARRQLREAMSAAHDEVLQLQQLLADERVEMTRAEAKARLALESDEHHSSHVIFLLQQKSMEEALELGEAKRTARGEFEEQALRHLRQIIDDEHESFDHLVMWGRENEERTQQRVVSNLRARVQHFERFKEWALMLWDSRCDDMKALGQQRLIEADQIAQVAELRFKVLKNFAADVVKEKSRMAVQELDARAELSARREREAGDVQSLMDLKGRERNSVAVCEAEQRQKLEKLEQTVRDSFAAARNDALDVIRRRRHEFMHQCKMLERLIIDGRHSIQLEEDDNVSAIVRAHEDAIFMTVMGEQARARERFEAHELRNRNEHVLSEIRYREHLRGLMAGEQRSFERHALATRDAYLHEVAIREETNRKLVEQMCREEAEHLRMDYVRETYEAEDLVLARLKIDLLRRQEYMREDPRQLDPFEEPIPEAEMSIAEFRKSVRMNSPHRPSAHSAVHCQLEYVETALDCGKSLRHLPMGLMTFMSEMIDRGNEVSLSAKDLLTRTKHENEGLKKTLDQLKCKAQAAKEKKGFYVTKLDRDAKFFKQKREQEKRLRLAEEQNLKNETMRCQEKQAAAKAMVERNEQLKDHLRQKHGSSAAAASSSSGQSCRR